MCAKPLKVKHTTVSSTKRCGNEGAHLHLKLQDVTKQTFSNMLFQTNMIMFEASSLTNCTEIQVFKWNWSKIQNPSFFFFFLCCSLDLLNYSTADVYFQPPSWVQPAALSHQWPGSLFDSKRKVCLLLIRHLNLQSLREELNLLSRRLWKVGKTHTFLSAQT